MMVCKLSPLLIISSLLIMETQGQSLYVMWNGVRYTDGDRIPIYPNDLVGRDPRPPIPNPGRAVVCMTEEVNTNCCRERDGGNVGEWYFTSGAKIPRINAPGRQSNVFRSGFTHELRLGFSDGTRLEDQLGSYTCRVPSQDGSMVHNLTIRIVDGTLPSTTVATTAKQTTPEATTVQPTTPEATTEEVTTPEVTTPEVTTVQPTTPEVTTPEVTTPEATTEAVTTPEVTTAEPTTPEATTPEATTPGVTTPEATTPGVTTPEATTPGVTTAKKTEGTTEDLTTELPTAATEPATLVTIATTCNTGLNAAASGTADVTGTSETYFRIKLFPGLPLCITWNVDRAAVLEAQIKSSVEMAVRERCNCTFSSSAIYSGQFSCVFGSSESECDLATYVTYRAVLNGTSDLLPADQLMGHIQDWRETRGTLIYNVFHLRLASNAECAVSVNSLEEAEC